MRRLARAAMSCAFAVIMVGSFSRVAHSQEPPVRVDQLTPAQFEALRDDQMIDVRGKPVSKRDLVAAAARGRTELQAKAEAARREREAAEEEERQNFDRSEQTRIEQENAKTRTEAASVGEAEPPEARGKRELRDEAAQLRARAARAASESELVDIHKRAQQLLEQLRRQ